MTNSTILITGGTGFAGSHLVEHLLESGVEKQHIHTTSFGPDDGFVTNLLGKENVHQLDLTDENTTQSLFQIIQPTQLYHLAAYAAVGSSFNKARKVLETNLTIQLNTLEAIKKQAPECRTLVVGSALEYDFNAQVSNLTTTQTTTSENQPLGPASPYGLSKVLQDLLGLLYAKSHKLDIIRARPFNHIGERQAPGFVIPDFAKQIVTIERGQQKSIKVGNLEATRDFTDVKDIVRAYSVLMNHGQSRAVYNIGSGTGYTISQMLDMLSQLAKTDIKVETDPAKLRPSDVPRVVADSSRVQKLGWQTEIPITTTLERVLNYWRENL